MTLESHQSYVIPSSGTAGEPAGDLARPASPAYIRATARLQFHKDFTFAHAIQLVDYYARMGISHLYASPILSARLGSTHGYDTVDPTLVNPELGGEAGLRQLVAKLRSVGMGLILDIVPNHMGVGGSENPWWQHVLEWGPKSPYAKWFDINWNSLDPAVHNKLLAPFLGAAYGETLKSGDLAMQFNADTGRIELHYHSHHFPIALEDYAEILKLADSEWLRPIILRAYEIDWKQPYSQIQQAAELLQEHLRNVSKTPPGASAIESALQFFNTIHTDGVVALHKLLERQNYRLTWWRNGADEINWRRFFEVSELAGVRMEEDEVFEATHAKIFAFYEEGLIDGLRIDHVDGLAEPRAYALKLRQRLDALLLKRPADLRTPPYIVVEKILAEHEVLREDWQLDGTTGYDFMDQVGAVLHDPAGEVPLSQMWRSVTGDPFDFSQHVRNARRQLLAENLVSEFEGTAHALHAIARADIDTRDISLATIRRVLREILVNFPVYRTYASCNGRDASDDAVFEVAAQKARKSLNNIDRPIVDILSRWLSGDVAAAMPASVDTNINFLCKQAITRFQQLTPPLSAKSVEDTAFYRYGRLLSRNEVGSDPGTFSIGTLDFHAAALQRGQLTPHSMLATATHDHKRGEDVRSRITVISEIPGLWEQSVKEWMGLNARYRRNVLEEDELTPAYEGPRAWHEIMLYQMIAGAWPFELAATDQSGMRAFAERLSEWQIKGIREAKRLSNWVQNNEAYEAACTEFVFNILSAENNEFLQAMQRFVDTIASPGAINSLSQTVLRLTVPGIPDLYQGTEFWDFSLVDPDNRRPVDFEARKVMVAGSSLTSASDTEILQKKLRNWQNGGIKQHVIQTLLLLRQQKPLIFSEGSYLPLVVTGTHASHVIAFMRVHEDTAIISIVTRLPFTLLADSSASGVLFPATQWQDTYMTLPDDVAVSSSNGWHEIFTGKVLRSTDNLISIADALGSLPQAVLHN